MFYKLIAIISLAAFLTACSTTKGGTNSGSFSDDPSAKYDLESKNLEPFAVIKGSKVGARAYDRVFFAYDSSVLTSAGQKTLDKQASWLKKNSKVTVTVEGHCDERGTREYNLALGDRRAHAVKAYLVSSGVKASNVKVVSYGKERPAVVGSNNGAWAENRRAVTVPKQ